MRSVLLALILAIRDLLRSRAALHAEIIALRHQLFVLRRNQPARARLRPGNRLLWVWLSRPWREWRSALILGKPETVIAWQRHGFRLYWAWKSRRRGGRPTVSHEVRELIRTMSHANPLWGAPRIHGELLKLGIPVLQATVATYMVHRWRPPSQTWRTFLANHVSELVAADFFVVPTAMCRVLFVLVIVAHHRRRVVHVAVTAHPAAGWTAQQLREAFPLDAAPGYLLRDRDQKIRRFRAPSSEPNRARSWLLRRSAASTIGTNAARPDLSWAATSRPISNGSGVALDRATDAQRRALPSWIP